MTTKAFKFSTFAFVLTAGLLTACSSDNDDNNVTPQEAPRLISVEVSEQPLASESAQARDADTRALITTTATLAGFSMHGVYMGTLLQNYSVEKKAEGWVITHNTWPQDVGDNDLVDFYAHTGDTFNNGSDPYISFKVDEDAFNQHDLLVAQNKVAYNTSQKPGNVSLYFRHACAAVAFSVKMTNTLNTQLQGKTLTVNSILLHNVWNSGKYYYNSGWKEVQFKTVNGEVKKSVYTLTNGAFTVSTDALSLPNNYLFMIPQKRAANGTNDMYLEVNYTFMGQTKSQAIIPLPVDWEAGKEYDIEIKLGTTLIQ